MSDGRSLLVWQNYAQLKNQSKIIRSGFGLCGVYHYDAKNPREPERSESVLEHVMGTLILLELISAYYPEVIPRAELPFYSLVLKHHEIGENIDGDIPDDGRRDEARKNRRELAAIRCYAEKLPLAIRSDLIVGFMELQARSSLRGQILCCIDKIEAVLQGLLYEMDGRVGDLRNKDRVAGMSEQDQRYIQRTGSDLLVDNWAAHFMDLIENMECKELFMEILWAAVMDVRGKWFDWI